MSTRNLKDNYEKYSKNTAPNMEKLWDRIEEGVDNSTARLQGDKISEERNNNQSNYNQTNNKNVPQQNITVMKKKKKNHLAPWIVAVAVFAFVLIGGRFAIENRVEQNKTYTKNDDNERITQTNYESLDFDYSENKTYSDYDYDGDDYFVETSVLKETNFFIDCKVIKLKEYSQYSEYTLEVINVICKEDEKVKLNKKITITSKTPYLLNEGGEYLLPMKENDGYFSIVFENAPQIEFTTNKEIVFHNGWNTLSQESAECIYPQENINDFYYDKMKIAYCETIDDLIERWKSI